ncbi:MAG: hypothetical protein H6719_32405 [Sandaracinaceae bacterium]|nr:hypothetical protein [Sandaracinaceae bacterium]
MLGGAEGARFFVLDGWRAISILLVLASHMLPSDSSAQRRGRRRGQMGMALFFTRKITTQPREAATGSFFVRRYSASCRSKAYTPSSSRAGCGGLRRS